MEARIARPALLAVGLFCLCSQIATAASYRTTNFVVTAATPQLAQEVCEHAEHFRKTLAIEWLGRELPQWQRPCPITVSCAPNLGAGGATSFMFDRGRPFGWRMNVQGSRVRILDSVLPHEVTHTIFATHFGRPLPRWADEGACTTVEHDSEKNKQKVNLVRFLQTRRGIAFNKMFAMKEYPPDVLPLYAQGYSVTRYLIAQRGKHHFVNYIGEGMQTNNWNATTLKYYGYANLSDLQVKWLNWVAQGSPPLDPVVAPGGSQTLIASNTQQQTLQPQPSGGSLAPSPSVYAVAQGNVPPRSLPQGLTARGQSPNHAGTGQPPVGRIAEESYPVASGAQPSTSLAPSTQWQARDHGRRLGSQAPSTGISQGLAAQNASQPRPTQQASTTILQWSKSSAVATQAAPATPITSPSGSNATADASGRSYYDRVSGLGRAVHRQQQGDVVIPFRRAE